MKINKQYILLIILLIIGVSMLIYLIPNFEREEFNTEIVEDISSGTITTTTLQKTTEENEDSKSRK